MAPPQGCQGDAASCVRALPLCDPCSSSCGGPTDLVGQVNALKGEAVLVAELEGARLADAGESRLQVRHDGAGGKAKSGYVLKGGDVLRLHSGETVRLDGVPPIPRDRTGSGKAGSHGKWIITADKRLMGPLARAAKDELVVVVTGPSLRAERQAERVMKPAVPIAEIEAALREPWRAHGEAGAPLVKKMGMAPFTSEDLRRHHQRNNAPAERTRRIFEALKAEQARRSR
jgi:hypothetical protein